MLTQYHSSAEVPAPLIKIALTFRFYGWLGFWLQLAMAFVATIALLLALSGRLFSSDTSVGNGVAVFWATLGILLLVVGILLDIRYIRIAKGLIHEAGALLHPRKSGTVRLLRFGVLIGFMGILMALIGAGTSVGVLVAKTVSQPPGVAILDPNKIVRTMDVLIVLSNITLIASHLIGTVIAFWLLDRVHHVHYSRPYIMQATLE